MLLNLLRHAKNIVGRLAAIRLSNNAKLNFRLIYDAFRNRPYGFDEEVFKRKYIIVLI